MSALLQAVSRARRKRDSAAQAFTRAVEEARTGGHSLQQIAEAAGLTRQRVWQIVTRAER